jgi:hypothetical protein
MSAYSGSKWRDGRVGFLGPSDTAVPHQSNPVRSRDAAPEITMTRRRFPPPWRIVEMAAAYCPAGEAGAIAGLPQKALLLLVAFCMRSLGMFLCGLRLLPSLGRMLLALGMVILVVRIGGGAVRLRGRLVMFRRLVVCVFHGIFSLLAD